MKFGGANSGLALRHLLIYRMSDILTNDIYFSAQQRTPSKLVGR
jgi:hypothetical protein